MATPVIFLMLLLVAVPLGIIAVLYLLVPLFKAIGWVVRQVFHFVGGELGDLLRIIGAVVTQAVLAVLVIGSILIGRWSASAHYGRALSAECRTMGLALYRVLIGHPARLLCLNNLVDGIERRIPEVVAAAPTADTPKGRSGQFEGYRIVGSLPGGGSGGKLYIAEPDTMKRAIFERSGQRDVRQVVIKTFSLRDGSSLPQIVRESRALDAAKRLGLVLEHELSDERFFYVTRYVPGESLGLVTQRLHAMCGGEGLDEAHLRKALGYTADLLRTLEEYHRGGLWHKDVKPDNIIVDARSAHLVDFGLVTPLRSAMTLTTHGTEYFRDPELVRMALKGVKVHQVDGAKFDVYAAGAVLFSIVENSFPAHGGLSQISKRCPEALRWIVRRSMAEYAKRYATASEMLRDVEYVALAADPFAVKPFELPSMHGAEGEELIADEAIRRTPEPVVVGDGSGAAAAFGPMGAAAGAVAAGAVGAEVGGAGAASQRPAGRPRIKIKSWWGGGATLGDDAERVQGERVVKVFPGVYVSGSINDALRAVGLGEDGGPTPPTPPKAPWTPRHAGVSAKEQLKRARSRAEAARHRAQARAHHRRRGEGRGDFKPINGGVAMALLLFAAVVGAFFLLAFWAVGAKRGELRVVSVYPTPEERGLAYASGDLLPITVERRDAGAAEEHGTRAHLEVRRSNSRVPQPRVVVDGAAAPKLDGPLPTLAGGRILVISELQPPPATVTAAIDRLRAGGAQVMGNYPGNPAGREEIDRQMLLDAEAKMKRGLAQLDSDDTSQELGEWLAESAAADVLLWFARGDQKESVRFYAYLPEVLPGQDEEHARHLATRAAVVEAVTAGSLPRSGR